MRSLIATIAFFSLGQSIGKVDLDADLLRAVMANRPEIVEQLLGNGANPNAIDGTDKTPVLIEAAERHLLKIVELLLQHGASVNNTDAEGNTALHRAVWWRQHDAIIGGREERTVLVSKLLIEAKANIDAANDVGMTPLMYASGWDHPDSVDVLLDAGAKSELMDKHGRTALTWAANEGRDSKIVIRLFSGGAKESLTDALLFCDWKKAKSMIVAGADVEKWGPYDETTLAIVAEHARADLVVELLKKKPDIEHRDARGYTALSLAVGGRPYISMLGTLDFHEDDATEAMRLATVKALLAAGAKVNGPEGRAGSVQRIARARGYESVVRALIESGAKG